MSARVLNEDELRRVVGINEEALDAVEQAFTWLQEDRVDMPPIMHISASDKNGDIDDIYARASLEEHSAASVGLASTDHGPSLEEAHPGWTQPARWLRS